MESRHIEIEHLNWEELLELQSKIFEKLKEYGDSGFKEGQRILIGDKYTKKAPFFEKQLYRDVAIESDEYKGIVGEYAYICSGELENYAADEQGFTIHAVAITLERDQHKKKKHTYYIHPDDVIIIK